MRSPRHLPLLALLAIAIGVGIPAAAQARAFETFYFHSDAGVQFRNYDLNSESPEWVEDEQRCWFNRSGNLVEGKSGEDGSITAIANERSGCSSIWTAAMGYAEGDLVVGAFGFWPQFLADGTAVMECYRLGELVEGFDLSLAWSWVSQVDGTTCTVERLPGVEARGSRLALLAPAGWHSRIVSSLAPVAAGTAKVEVQVSGAGSRSVKDEVTLRTRSGRLVGAAAASGRSGARPHRIAVPLAPFARRALARRGELVVHARLTHADGTPGTGDRTGLLTLSASAKPRR